LPVSFHLGDTFLEGFKTSSWSNILLIYIDHLTFQIEINSVQSVVLYCMFVICSTDSLQCIYTYYSKIILILSFLFSSLLQLALVSLHYSTVFCSFFLINVDILYLYIKMNVMNDVLFYWFFLIAILNIVYS